MSCIATTLISNYEVSPASTLGVLLARARTNDLFLRTGSLVRWVMVERKYRCLGIRYSFGVDVVVWHIGIFLCMMSGVCRTWVMMFKAWTWGCDLETSTVGLQRILLPVHRTRTVIEFSVRYRYLVSSSTGPKERSISSAVSGVQAMI